MGPPFPEPSGGPELGCWAYFRKLRKIVNERLNGKKRGLCTRTLKQSPYSASKLTPDHAFIVASGHHTGMALSHRHRYPAPRK